MGTTTRRADPRSDVGRGRDRVALLLGLLVVASAHVAVAVDARAPVQTKDEIGYLAAARWFATGEGAGLLTPEHAGGYAVGWGLLTAPLWWLTASPPTVYALSVAVNVVLAVLLLLPAAAVARRCGPSTPGAVTAAVVVCLGAGRLGYTGYALPETLLTLQLTTLLWLLLRLWDPVTQGPDGGRGRLGSSGPVGVLAALALLLAWLPTTHARMLPVAVLAGLSLASWAWARRSPAGLVALAAGSLGAGAGWWLNTHVEAVLYGDVARTAVAAQQVAGLQVADALALAVGHAWYAAVAWLGLSLLGWATAVAAARGEWRERALGPWTWLGLSVVVQVGVGAAYLSSRLDSGGRVDQLVYGRYGDPLWFVAALVGAAVVLAGARTAAVRRTVVVAATALPALSGATALALALNADRVAGFVQLNVPGLEAWAWRDGAGFVVPWWPATLTAALVLAVLAHAVLGSGPGSRRRVAALVSAGAVLLGLALVAERRNIEPRDAWIRSLFGVRELVQQHPDAEVVLVVDRPLLLSGNALQWWLADRSTTVVDPADLATATSVGALVVGPTALVGADLATPGGAVGTLLGTDATGTYGVWQVP